MPSRLPSQPYERIDRNQRISFRFEGRKYTGFAGDTISSALLANGVNVLGRSFKYHRARSVFSFANHDVNGMMQDGDELNLRADITEIQSEMELYAVNTFGGLSRDRGRIIEWLSFMLPVGFYYKAFHKPRSLFPLWERLIRGMAGLGRLNTTSELQRQPKEYAFCDVLVIGAGPSGLAAALTAAEAGAQVTLIDEQTIPGGSLGIEYGGDEEIAVVRNDLVKRTLAHKGIAFRLSTVASAYYADHLVPLVSAHGLVKMRARAIIVASGVYEQPAVFRGNDLPGVMLASAAQRLIHQYAIKPCERAVILAANSSAYRAALDLSRVGIKVVAVVDLNDPTAHGTLAASVMAQGIEVLGHTTVYEAWAKDNRLAGVELHSLSAADVPAGLGVRQLDCDGLIMSVGWAPAAALLYQAGARMTYAERPGQFIPTALPDGVFAAGRVNGVFQLQDRMADGRAAAAEALTYLKIPISAESRPGRSSEVHSHPFPIFDHPKDRNFVDLDEDLQLKDIRRAVAEGFDNIELLKRYSTVGMGPSQGKHSNMNAIRILANINGISIDKTGTTTSRPFYHPIPIRALAGRRLRPERRTPMHAWHDSHGAELMMTGHWIRPKFYGPGSQADAVAVEVMAVRTSVGLIDVSTLGKLELFGPDAGELLDRAYTQCLSNIRQGRTRYALMVDEAGVIIDDGIAARLGEEHFYLTTTTTAAEGVHRTLQRLAIEWRLQVDVINRTGQIAAMNMAGPLTREVLTPLTDIDLSAEGFPFLGVRMGRIAGVSALIMRVGFVGELGYEIHVPAAQAVHVWKVLMAAGKERGIRPFGVEAQRQLRLEKGHIIVGQDTDGTSTPFDTNMSWAVNFNKSFFIGKRSLQVLADKARYRLVGFALPSDYIGPLPLECHLVIDEGDIVGRVTSIGASPSLGQVIGLAMIESRLGEVGSLDVRVDGGVMVRVVVVPVPFYDPDNLRQKVASTAKGIAA